MSQQTPSIQAEVREHLGTRYAARLREAGQLPAVIYGHKQDPLHVAVNTKKAVELLHANAHLFEVHVNDKVETCLVKDIQWNHLGNQIIHLDLTRVDLDEKVTVEVTLHFTGEPAGAKEQGVVLEHPTDSLQIECLVNQIPDEIMVNLNDLQIGQTLTVGDLELPTGVKAVTDADTVVASLSEVAEEPEAEEGEATEEPELIGRKPGEEGEEAES